MSEENIQRRVSLFHQLYYKNLSFCSFGSARLGQTQRTWAKTASNRRCGSSDRIRNRCDNEKSEKLERNTPYSEGGAAPGRGASCDSAASCFHARLSKDRKRARGLHGSNAGRYISWHSKKTHTNLQRSISEYYASSRTSSTT